MLNGPFGGVCERSFLWFWWGEELLSVVENVLRFADVDVEATTQKILWRDANIFLKSRKCKAVTQ